MTPPSSVPASDSTPGAGTVVPCRRPKVTIGTEAVASGPLAHRVTCLVPGCRFSYGPAVKSDAEQQATWHRQHHRAAVPDTAILLALDGHQAECDCGEKWMAPTKAHARHWLRHHLALEHGVVECT